MSSSGKNFYEIGYRKPPAQHRFKKGQSGNRKGRPRKTETEPIDFGQVLNEPLQVRLRGTTRTLPAFEVMLRQLVQKAAKEHNLDAALEFLKLCETYGLIKPSASPQADGGVVVMPKDWDPDEWVAMLRKHGRPPWPGKRNGLPKSPR